MQENIASPQPEPTPAALNLAERIRREGPVTVAEFMAEAVSHYYAAHKPFGVEGDFITAPEISQMFGEMVGAWLTDLWLQMGQPDRVQLIELGPGRGTLAADVMRTISSWPEFKAAVSLHLVETSPQLRQIQAATLKGYHPTWYDSLDDVPEGICFVVANEFFDALPIHQFQKVGGEWMERRVKYSETKKKFEFTHVPADFDIAGIMPESFVHAPDSSIFEISPASLSVLESICARIAHGGAALIIDYGHAEAGLGDTLQAMEKHRYADVLENVGGRDLTAHVDFGTFSTVAAQIAQVHGPVTQGEFLTRLGIEQRGDALRANATPAEAKEVELALYRLIAPSEMGTLFKVMGLTAPDATVTPSGFMDERLIERDVEEEG